MKDIECPYCGHEQDICHDDGHGYSEDEFHQEQCENCEKNFVFTTYISFSYTPYKADCLNDGNHDFKKTTTCPDVFSKMRCTMCAEEREMTEQEQLSFGIKTKEEYFKELNNQTPVGE